MIVCVCVCVSVWVQANKWINFFWCSMLAMAPIYLGIVIQVCGTVYLIVPSIWCT